MVNVCPHCQRKLLTHTSAKCNWCGEPIPDAAYQQAAEVERATYFAHQAQRDAPGLANIEAISTGAYDPLSSPWLDPFLGPPVARPGSWQGVLARERAQQRVREA